MLCAMLCQNSKTNNTNNNKTNLAKQKELKQLRIPLTLNYLDRFLIKIFDNKIFKIYVLY